MAADDEPLPSSRRRRPEPPLRLLRLRPDLLLHHPPPPRSSPSRSPSTTFASALSTSHLPALSRLILDPRAAAPPRLCFAGRLDLCPRQICFSSSRHRACRSSSTITTIGKLFRSCGTDLCPYYVNYIYYDELLHVIVGRSATVVGFGALLTGLRHLGDRYGGENVGGLSWALIAWFLICALIVICLEYYERQRQLGTRER